MAGFRAGALFAAEERFPSVFGRLLVSVRLLLSLRFVAELLLLFGGVNG